jgi:hypothetical protein
VSAPLWSRADQESKDSSVKTVLFCKFQNKKGDYIFGENCAQLDKDTFVVDLCDGTKCSSSGSVESIKTRPCASHDRSGPSFLSDNSGIARFWRGNTEDLLQKLKTKCDCTEIASPSDNASHDLFDDATQHLEDIRRKKYAPKILIVEADDSMLEEFKEKSDNSCAKGALAKAGFDYVYFSKAKKFLNPATKEVSKNVFAPCE